MRAWVLAVAVVGLQRQDRTDTTGALAVADPVVEPEPAR